MIKNWLVRGDCHSDFLWMNDLNPNKYIPEETGIIILGDAGINFYLNKTDYKKKKDIQNRGYHIYAVRGNHEARPQDVEGMETAFDTYVHGIVYYEPDFPNIRYFLDYGFYDIGGYNCLIIGGAYSVDKAWRLQRCMLTEETNIPKKSGWWANEQLSPKEMESCMRQIQAFVATGKYIDFIMTHTCPYSIEPRDMFLGFIDQSTVDDSMEHWMDEIMKTIHWNIWLFGHFHADRLERPHIEQYFNDIEELDEIVKRWKKYDETGELDWWLQRSPNFNIEDKK